jgi:hypothetical protein
MIPFEIFYASITPPSLVSPCDFYITQVKYEKIRYEPVPATNLKAMDPGSTASRKNQNSIANPKG